MVVENKGLRIDRFFIPPFRLYEGELIGICIYGGAHQPVLLSKLTALFSGRLKSDAVHFGKPLTYVEHIKESSFRSRFWPLTVGEYLDQNSDTASPFATKIYDFKFITARTRINSLEFTELKLLALYATLSKSKAIVFDLNGQSPDGAAETVGVVKSELKNGVAALLIDWCEDMKPHCTRFINMEIDS